MFTAQNQADFMSANGVVIHTGPGGSTVTQRLLAAGYPLGGDLSLGGFRSENIIALNVNMSAQDAVTAWMGDAPHQYTMLSPDLTEIGAGVAVAGGLAYYVIDCARPSAGGAPLAVSTQAFESGTAVPANEAANYPISLKTPNADGDVIHDVQSGQTLWQIAIAYEVKIDDIRRLNNLFGNDIYPGNKLLIKKDITPTITSPTETAMPEATVTVVPSATQLPTITATAPLSPVAPVAQNNNTLMTSVIMIIILAILGGGYFTWLGSSEKEKIS
jgi:LysM repeat protein